MTPAIAPTDRPNCRICGSASDPLGTVHGRYSDRDYELWRCQRCRFAFVANPWTEFGEIYDDRYYAGKGADPLVDYWFELDHPQDTVRRYEWDGITEIVAELAGDLDKLRWLDFGCGNGGLVRHLRANTAAEAFGFEEGSIAASAAQRGIPFLTAEQLAEQSGGFDVVTAVEVLEHTLDPLAELRTMRRLLRPGGLLFLTTGNAAPFAEKLTEWAYVVPEIHISFFEPSTLEYAMTEAGFRPEHPPLGSGFDQVIKFKVLKNLRVRRRNPLTDAIPSRPLAALANRRVRLDAHPVGRAV